MSIDDVTPEEWNALNKGNSLGKSYSNLINTMVDHPPHYNNGHV